MASKNCQWLWALLKCCGWERKDKALAEIEESASEEEIIGDSTSFKFIFDEIALNGPAEAFHATYAVLSSSCPTVIDNSPTFWRPKDDHRGYKCSIIKTRNYPDPSVHHQKLYSDSRINLTSKAPFAAKNDGSPPTLNPLVGDGVRGTQLQSPVTVEAGLKPSDDPSHQSTDDGENQLNAGESVPPPPKDAKPPADPSNGGADNLTRFTSPANLRRKRNNPTIIVYHVTVAERSRNPHPEGLRSEEDDVEMEDLTNQSEDVEMADLTVDASAPGVTPAAAAPDAREGQDVEVVATIQQGISSASVALKSGNYSSSINVVASMTYVSGSGGGGGRMMSESETSMSVPEVTALPSENSQETIVVIGDPGCKRTILWNEAVKVIYYNRTSKLHSSETSGEGKQDLVCWEIVPLKNAPKGSRSKWVKAVKSGFIRSDLYTQTDGGTRPYQSEQDMRRDGTEEDGCEESSSSFTSSSSTSSSGDNKCQMH
ncbi:uncharacterized protein LOC124164843 isoform X2 [Ischnura elegans]|uniref:uncharacterized protein LOC124164843 isoform X2 n=1 Tax=Ischnura elegans TaxID=197161 RepID=UPI001ED874BC|nr:uncharacterized protein LOC124164843 isoform X2 [Ischnura elegans]